jgi:uracil-DNA glycosylase
MLAISHGNGCPTAKILFLKDSPSFDEVKHQEMFADSAGFDFKKMMIEANINFVDTYATCLTRQYRTLPLITNKKAEANSFKRYFKINTFFIDEIVKEESEQAFAEIKAVNPLIVVPLGPVSLLLLTNESSLATWRGSMMWSEKLNCKIIPTYSPQQVQRMYSWRYQVVRDLQRVSYESNFKEIRKPKKDFIISPSFVETLRELNRLIKMADDGR